MTLLIGASVYSYKDWIGPFYPEGTKPAGMLAYYASRFDAVELNYTYGRLYKYVFQGTAIRSLGTFRKNVFAMTRASRTS